MTPRKLKNGIGEVPALTLERAKMYAAREAALARGECSPLPTRITNSTTKGRYVGHELSAPAVRRGADDHMALPSRWFGTRRYPNEREMQASQSTEPRTPPPQSTQKANK